MTNSLKNDAWDADDANADRDSWADIESLEVASERAADEYEDDAISWSSSDICG